MPEPLGAVLVPELWCPMRGLPPGDGYLSVPLICGVWVAWNVLHAVTIAEWMEPMSTSVFPVGPCEESSLVTRSLYLSVSFFKHFSLTWSVFLIVLFCLMWSVAVTTEWSIPCSSVPLLKE